MSSYRQILYHIVFRTKDSRPIIEEAHKDELFRYIWGIIHNNHCTLYRINGVEDHIHILSDLHPSVCLADYMKDIKAGSSLWIKKNVIFPRFSGWGEGYGAFTVGYREKDMIINYIKKQQEHHKKVSFLEEYRSLLEEFGIVYNIQYI